MVIGAIACRLERQPDGSGKLYIMTIGVLAPYRGYGVGAPCDLFIASPCSPTST